MKMCVFESLLVASGIGSVRRGSGEYLYTTPAAVLLEIKDNVDSKLTSNLLLGSHFEI